MKQAKHFFLIHVEYLGFRYHGWQKQKDVKTVQHMIDRTFYFILGHENYKTLAASRTDAMVSATHQLFELFIFQDLDTIEIKKDLNLNLPADIRIKHVEKVDEKFKIINDPKIKEYHYYFSYGEKYHPYCSPFLINFFEELNIEKMQKAAALFEGQHNFKEYCYRPNDGKVFEREIIKSEIVENTFLTANFFPKNSFAYIVKGTGFLHHQIRLMMGTLIKVGRGELELQDITSSLHGKGSQPIGFIAPSSGLHLYKNELISED
jgi:tRNA pseudouridine38-40 synthase